MNIARFLFFSLFFYSIVWATADGPDFWKVDNVASNDVLNVRANSSWKSQNVGEIPFNGVCLHNLECVGGLTMQEIMHLSESQKATLRQKRPKWCKVKYKQIIGWVSSRYLREGQDPHCYEKE